MRLRLLALPCVVVVAAPLTAAGSDLSLQIGPDPRPQHYDAIFYSGFIPRQRQYFDVSFNESGTLEDERLVGYDLSLRIDRPSGVIPGYGVTLAGAARPADNFVFGASGGASFDVVRDTPENLLIRVSSLGGTADVNTGDKVARVFYSIDPATRAFGRYSIVVDAVETVFSSDDPNDPRIAVNTADGGEIAVLLDPEPGTFSLVCAAGGLALLPRPQRTSASQRRS